MISWLVAGFLYLSFCAFAVEEESPFNIAVQTGLAGYIWYIGGLGWLIDLYIPLDHPNKDDLSYTLEVLIERCGGRVLAVGIVPRGWNIFAAVPVKARFLERIGLRAAEHGFIAEEGNRGVQGAEND